MARKRRNKRPEGDAPPKKKLRRKYGKPAIGKKSAITQPVGRDPDAAEESDEADEVADQAEQSDGLPKPSVPGKSVVLMDVAEIKFSQRSVFDSFNENKAEGDTLLELIDAILKGKLQPADIPLIRVAKKKGSYWSIDNRRLFVYKHCRLGKIPVEVWQWTDMREFELKWKNGRSTREATGGGLRVAMNQRSGVPFPKSNVIDFVNSHVLHWFTPEEQEKHDVAIEALSARYTSQESAAKAKCVRREQSAEKKRLRKALGGVASVLSKGPSASGAAAVEMPADNSDDDGVVVELKFG